MYISHLVVTFSVLPPGGLTRISSECGCVAYFPMSQKLPLVASSFVVVCPSFSEVPFPGI